MIGHILFNLMVSNRYHQLCTEQRDEIIFSHEHFLFALAELGCFMEYVCDMETALLLACSQDVHRCIKHQCGVKI